MNKAILCRGALLLSLFLPHSTSGAESHSTPANQPAKPRLAMGRNPHYFDYGGKPVALFGSGLWTILPDTSIDIAEHNAWYAKYRANANRVTLFAFCTSVNDGNGLAPWVRVSGHGRATDGRDKFDLSRANQAFWTRAHRYFSDCEERGIVVLLQIFDEPFTEAGDDRWAVNPFNPDNNVNQIPHLPGGNTSGEAAFYDPDNETLLSYQDALVTRLLDETARRYGNIIYEIANEYNMDSATPKEVAWQQHWIRLFRQYEQQHGVQLLLTNDTRAELIASAGDAFRVINDHGLGLPHGNQVTWEDIWQRVTSDFSHFERPIINSRPRSDPDRKKYNDIVTEDKGREIFWSYLASGGHVIGFRTTESSWKDGLAAERIIQSVHTFLDTTDFAKLVPRRDLVDRGLCLASPGYEYVIYLPRGGEVRVNLENVAEGRQLSVVRFDPRHLRFDDLGSIGRTDSARFSMPGSGPGQDWVLHLGTGGGPWPARARKKAFPPTADFYVHATQPDQSFGHDKQLRVGQDRIAFLTFDLGDVDQLIEQNGRILSAKLRLTTTNGSHQGGGTIHRVAEGVTMEEKTTWNEKPAVQGPALARLGPVSIGGIHELDVTPAVRGKRFARFAIRSEHTDGAGYGSRESATPPILELSFD